ncbi:unnamed protein product [Closterium sp. Yama58-4]|nr:unnamed protein product [Closterium sp. Yama58-4]
MALAMSLTVAIVAFAVVSPLPLLPRTRAVKVAKSEWPILQELKNEWGAFTGSDTWLPNSDCATISGVFCNQEGSVIKLSLPGRGLTGSIPTSIVTLRMGRINLSDNRLTGPIPPTLFNEDVNVELIGGGGVKEVGEGKRLEMRRGGVCKWGNIVLSSECACVHYTLS